MNGDLPPDGNIYDKDKKSGISLLRTLNIIMKTENLFLIRVNM